MRKLKRTKNFDLSLEIKQDDFVRPPHEFQRNWLLNRAVREAADDLDAIHGLAARFVAGGDRHTPRDMLTAELSEAEIMEDWQLPIMEAMAEIAAGPDRDLLEVGYGRGISAAMIQQRGVRSHTMIECNDHLAGRCEQQFAGRNVRVVRGLWQDVIDQLGQFDSIFFHTYALDELESAEATRNVTFSAPFFPAAAAHLRPGGVFTYLTNEIDSLSRAHQRLIFEHFRSFRLHIVKLRMPSDVRDVWWADSMAVVEVSK